MSRASQVWTWRAVVVVVAGVVAGLAYSGFLLVLRDEAGELDLTVVSSLEAPGGRWAGALRTLDVVSGVMALVLVPYLWWALPAGRWRPWVAGSVTLFAVGGIVAGLVPLPCPDGTPGCPAGGAEEVQVVIHDGFSIVSTVALYLSAGVVALALRRTGPRWAVVAAVLAVGFGAATGVAYGIADLMGADDVVGAVQRLQILGVSAWVICLGVLAGTVGVRLAPPPLGDVPPGVAARR